MVFLDLLSSYYHLANLLIQYFHGLSTDCGPVLKLNKLNLF